jgi:hypothetical protein
LGENELPGGRKSDKETAKQVLEPRSKVGQPFDLRRLRRAFAGICSAAHQLRDYLLDNKFCPT